MPPLPPLPIDKNEPSFFPFPECCCCWLILLLSPLPPLLLPEAECLLHGRGEFLREIAVAFVFREIEAVKAVCALTSAILLRFPPSSNPTSKEE